MTITQTNPIRKGVLIAFILTVPLSVRAADPPSTPASDPASVIESKATFESRGKTIAVECFEPSAPGKHPVAVVLHGSAGLTVGALMFRDQARDLAAHGYLVVLPHYFDRTGTTLADMPTMVENFPTWMQTVADASSYALDLPSAEPDHVALVGFSLGGYLALSTSTFDPRVIAVVDYFGGLPDLLAPRADRLPPTLILHGDADPIVPVSEAAELETLLETNQIPFEKHIYPKAGHGFFGPSSLDATNRTRAFLDRHLKPAPQQAQTASASTP